MKMDYPEAVRAYLKFVLEHLRLSPTALAKRSGMASTTLTRFLNSADHQFLLSSTSLDKIAKTTGLSPAPFMEGGQAMELRSVLAGQTPIESLVTTIVEADLAVGVWKSAEIYRHRRFELNLELPPPIPGSGHFYCAVSDRSIEKIAKRGDYLYCERIADVLEIDPNRRDGALVIIERVAEDQNTFETSARVLSIANHNLEFHLCSGDVRFSRDSVLNAESSPKPKVLGFALCVVRALRFSRDFANADRS